MKRHTLALGLLVLGSAACEGLVRLADGNALPHLHLFEQDGERIHLQAEASQRLRRADGGTYELSTSTHGLRGQARLDAVVVGDSQVLGLGVADDQPFPALLGLGNAGVPAYGLEDSLRRAEELAPERLLVIVNQANDFEEWGQPVHERYHIRGGWLISVERSGWFWASPLSNSHLLSLSALILQLVVHGLPEESTPGWLAEPEAHEAAALAMGESLSAWARAHPETELAVAWLPLDLCVTAREDSATLRLGASAEQLADETLFDAVERGLGEHPLIDLRPALRDRPEAFLPNDYHLSPDGHARVAELLKEELPWPSP